MTSQHDKPKRWRPRFSVRTLAIVVTLACCYAACWGPTKTSGVEDVARHVVQPIKISGFWPVPSTVDTANGASATLPLVVATYDMEFGPGLLVITRRHYYFWFFGHVAKLPFEREISVSRLKVRSTPRSLGPVRGDF